MLSINAKSFTTGITQLLSLKVSNNLVSFSFFPSSKAYQFDDIDPAYLVSI